jgi:hypothetical protein
MTDSTHQQQQADGPVAPSEPDDLARYLAGVTPEQAQRLATVNTVGLAQGSGVL